MRNVKTVVMKTKWTTPPFDDIDVDGKSSISKKCHDMVRWKLEEMTIQASQ